ncbi:adhesion G protein-coupled receptor F5-like [Hyla sarda]|uniref:adhesion G protein-coupled receptor F5-like n=1 Tax=Hyla sarda TaxID=327740 RepID=UPI0024C2AF35|nr:adhesion G protein-coupled receptor F5-like [Hyla sarda]
MVSAVVFSLEALMVSAVVFSLEALMVKAVIFSLEALMVSAFVFSLEALMVSAFVFSLEALMNPFKNLRELWLLDSGSTWPEKLKPNITVSPVKLFSGDTGTITCNFSDVTDVSWSRDAIKISNNSKYTTSSTIRGSYQLRIKDLENSDSGTYTCTGTLNGTSQSLSIGISISKVDINPSRNIDTFCDGSKWSISCCSDDILLFNVTWQAEDAPGDQSSNSTCSIYTLTADTSRCSSSQPNKYTCNFLRNEGARASNVITITYITKANISITRVSPISAGKALDIICTTNVTVNKIELAKDTTSNVKASSSGTSRVTFPIGSTTPDWSGIFICTAYQSTLTSSQNITVEVVALPQDDSIKVYPLQSYVKCAEQAELKCCVFNQNYSIYFRNNSAVTTPGKPSGNQGNMACFIYSQSVECNPNAVSTVYCVVTNKLSDRTTSKDAMTISLLKGEKTCSAEGNRPETPSGRNYSVPCQERDPTQLGNIIYPCKDEDWGQEINLCYSEKIFSAFQSAQDLVNGPDVQQNLATFLENITTIAIVEKQNIGNSSKNIEFMVNIISIVASTNVAVSKPMMKNLLQTVDIVVNNITSWEEASNQSSTVLKSVESFAKNLQFNDTFSSTNDNTSNIQVFGKVVKGDTGYNGNFSLAGLSSNVMIKSGTLPGDSNTVVTIAYSTMKDLLPQNKTRKVNALVMSTVINNSSSIDSKVFNITMTFTKSNLTLINPDCVWLDLDRQYWSNGGCIALSASDEEMVKCSCNHLTSFSVLMGDNDAQFLTIITYVGVSISIVSLVITLLIEAVVWRSVIKNKTSYMRHVCLVNIAVTLLIADIWFMIGAALEKYPTSDACTAVAFLTFYFYLSLFFWMLVLGLILFYRLIYLLHDMSRRIMMIIAFCLGYGCPLLIAIITVAATAPSGTFTSGKFCWLSYKPVTFLAFVIPALTIVIINVFILIVVIIKLLRPGIGERHGHEEKQAFVVIVKSIAVLTPLLGSTWVLGLVVATDPSNNVVHGIFAALNSFQGLFILISTVLLDQNVRKIVRSSISNSYWSTLRTKVQTTSTNSSASSKPYRKKLFGKGGGYDFYSAQSSTNDNSTNSYSVLA